MRHIAPHVGTLHFDWVHNLIWLLHVHSVFMVQQHISSATQVSFLLSITYHINIYPQYLAVYIYIHIATYLSFNMYANICSSPFGIYGIITITAIRIVSLFYWAAVAGMAGSLALSVRRWFRASRKKSPKTIVASSYIASYIKVASSSLCV